jgi:hypothetical protein
VLPTYPDDHRAAAANALRLPRRGLRLDKHQMVWRYGEPDRRRLALITVFANGGYIENAGRGKCIDVALGDLSARSFALRVRLRRGRRRDAGRNRKTAERDCSPCDNLSSGERVGNTLRHDAGAGSGRSIHCDSLLRLQCGCGRSNFPLV